MRVHITITLMILGVLLPARQPRAVEGTYDFVLACAIKPQQWRTIVISGDYAKGEATVSRPDGTLSRAFVAFTGEPPQRKLAILIKGKGRSGEWRDLYVIDTALGTVSHVNEVYADGPDKPPSMVLEDGTCRPSR